jgi:hypothetical protein
MSSTATRSMNRSDAPLAILGDNLVLVGNPVLVPSVDGSRVVNAQDIDRLDLKVGVFKLR